MQSDSLNTRGFHLLLFWMVVMGVVILDQTTKMVAIKAVEHGTSVLIPGIMNLVHAENTGAAFSIGQGGGVLFIAIAMAVAIGTCMLVWRRSDLPMGLIVSIALVAGGGLGNMINRMLTGSVTDFLATAFIDFPVFNVADICITVGTILTLVGYLLWSRNANESTGRILPDETE